MNNRLYLKEKKCPLIDIAKKHNALYITGDKAIFTFPGKWRREAHDSVKPAIMITDDGKIDIGQIRKSCDNWEDKITKYYRSKEVAWIISKLTQLQKIVAK